MRVLKHLSTYVLLLLIGLSVSGVVNAKLTSAPETQGTGWHSGKTLFANLTNSSTENSLALGLNAGISNERERDQANAITNRRFSADNQDKVNGEAREGALGYSVADLALLSNNNANWRADLQRARNGDGSVDYLLPQFIKDWRDNLNQAMEANRQSSAQLKGDAVGTALSVAAFPADIVVDLSNALISSVDLATDSLGSTGVLGKDLQAEAVQNLRDLGVKVEYLLDNKAAIAAAIAKSLKAYPGRVADLDPAALRSLTAIVGEAAMPAAAVARMRGVGEVADVGSVVKGASKAPSRLERMGDNARNNPAVHERVDRRGVEVGDGVADGELPELKLTKDEYSIKASVSGDSKAFIRVETPSQGIIEVTDIFRGNLPKGEGSLLLAKALKGHSALPTKRLVFKNITNEPTVTLFKAGGSPAESVLGKTGARTLQQLNLEPSNFSFQLSRGKLNLIIDVK